MQNKRVKPFFLSLQDSQEKNANPVKAEEAKLKAKYPGLGQRPGGSDFLMKRLQKGVSYYSLPMTRSETAAAATAVEKQGCALMRASQKTSH